jgi:microcystin degradation protein MlrC
VQLTPLDEAIQQAIHAPKGSVILADGADAPSGGAPGDSNTILRELLNKQTNVKILINIVDPEAVDIAIKAGVGNDVTVTVGRETPVQVTGKVRLVSDGILIFTGAGYLRLATLNIRLLDSVILHTITSY